MEDASKILPFDLLSKVRDVIDGNQVKGDELNLVSSTVEPFDLLITVKWEFYASWSDQEIAGGNPSNSDYGYNLSKFKNHHQNNLKTACNDTSLRQNFLTNLSNQGVDGILISKSKTTITSLGTHSYSYDCGHCNAYGRVNCGGCGGVGWNICYSCGGGGRKQEFYTVYDSYSKQNISRSRWVNCGGCFGTGRVTCGGCGGSGRVTCPTCGGLCFFTLYRSTDVVANPKSYYKITGDLHADQIVQLLADKGHEFTFSRVEFTHYKKSSPDYNIEQFMYYGNSYTTEIITDLRSEYYTVAGLGIPIYPFIRPPIFDQLFKEEIAELLEIKEQQGKVRKQSAVKFFNHFIDQPVLSSALKTIANERTKDDMDVSHIITNACQGYISSEASRTFSDAVTAILDKVSPPYHGLTWAIWGVLSVIFVLFWTESAFENFIFNYGFHWLEFPIYILYSLFGLFIFFTIFTIPIVIISAFIVGFKSHNVPEEYRQNLRHKEVFKKCLKGLGIVWIIGSIYGVSAGYQIVPKLNYQPFTWAYNNLLTDEQKTQFDEKCLALLKPVHYYPGACQYLRNQNPMTKIIEEREFRQSLIDSINDEYSSEGEKVVAIQQLLHQTYPEVEIDGIYGKTTQSKSVELLQSQSIPINDDANLNEIIEAFKQFE
ncbi:hypothetical protein ACBQ04_12275 [Psychrobacter faecalis]